MKKILSYPLSALFFLSFGLLLVIFHPIQWICLKLFGYSAHKWSVDTLNFFLTHVQILLLNRVQFTNSYNLPTDRSIIFVSNHQSMFDIPTLIWSLRKYHPKFISKIELTRGIPSISINLKHGGGANIDRKDKKQSIGEIIKLGRRMKDNTWSTVIFAEGTRSKDGKMKPFQVGGIATLLKIVPDALVVPVAIENSWKIVRYGTFPLGIFLPLRWTVLQPIETNTLSPEELVQEAENRIRSVIEKN
jgi:1-acyl-sn-glycerol-3-phosphate acyltransferase